MRDLRYESRFQPEMSSIQLKPFFSESLSGSESAMSCGGLDIVFRRSQLSDVALAAEKLRARANGLADSGGRSYVEVLHAVGRKWETPRYHLRVEALKILPAITCQSRELVERELSLVTSFLAKPFLSGLLEREIGGEKFLDGWVTEGDISARRHPLGLLLHNLAGNAFAVSALSITLGLLSRNVNLVKPPAGDPYFAVRFAESIHETCQEVEQDLAVIYWPGSETTIYERLFSDYIDACIAWGGAESRNTLALMAARLNKRLIDHGPKISLAVVDAPSRDNVSDTAHGVAFDVAWWEQNACHSPRMVFVRDGDVTAKQFAAELAAQMDNIARELPPLSSVSTDSSRAGGSPISPNEATLQGKAGATLSKRERWLLTLGDNGEIFESEGTAWTVVYSEDKPAVQELDDCVSRFIIAHKIRSLDEVISFITENRLQTYLQTLSYKGDDERFKDEITFHGVSHITQPGQMVSRPPGSSHDGFYNLGALTRIVTQALPFPPLRM